MGHNNIHDIKPTSAKKNCKVMTSPTPATVGKGDKYAIKDENILFDIQITFLTVVKFHRNFHISKYRRG